MTRNTAKNKHRSNAENGVRKIRIDDLNTLSPLTEKQTDTVTAYRRNKNLLLHGIAGTGKTFIATSLALEEVLDPSSNYSSLHFVRSIVPTRDIGFLKGDDKEKIAVYEAPYKAICGELFNRVDSYDTLKAQGIVSFLSTSFIRGLTLNDCIIVVDEFENLSFHELDSIITRMGNNSKIIFCGDYTQSDLTKTNEKNGCLDFMKILRNMNEFVSIEFGIDDIVRGKTVKNYIVNKYKLGLHV
jgi:phosphate starvation-inducible protein PhoH